MILYVWRKQLKQEALKIWDEAWRDWDEAAVAAMSPEDTGKHQLDSLNPLNVFTAPSLPKEPVELVPALGVDAVGADGMASRRSPNRVGHSSSVLLGFLQTRPTDSWVRWC